MKRSMIPGVLKSWSIIIMIVDTIFYPGLKSKFSILESCFGSGIHFSYNPNFRVRGPCFVSIQSNFDSSSKSLQSKKFWIVCKWGLYFLYYITYIFYYYICVYYIWYVYLYNIYYCCVIVLLNYIIIITHINILLHNVIITIVLLILMLLYSVLLILE